MNITYFLNFYPTQHKIVAHDEMMEMSMRGHKITVIAVWGGEKDKITALPFQIIYLQHKVKWINLFNLLFRNFIKSAKHLLFLKQYLGIRDSLRYISSYPDLKLKEADHIHVHFASNAALRGYLASKFYNLHFSCTGHGSELLLYPEPYLKKLILNSKPFITISEYNKKLLTEKYSLPEDKIIVNYCGVDIEHLKRLAFPYPERFTIVSVTALKEIKGVKHLIDACNILKRQNAIFTCDIIGGGKDYHALKNYIDDLELGDDVKLIGEISQQNIRDYLLKVSVFVLPSLSEGIPVAVMEAMAMELPVIATNITGLPEIIDDRKSGFLVPPGDSNRIAEKINFFGNHPEMIMEMGKHGRKIVQQKFNLKKNVTKFEKLIQLEATDR